MKSVEGIILKKSPRREADAVFTLYTKEHGLMELVAKGVRKGSAKLKSGLDVFNHAEIFYAPAKHWSIVTDFKIKNNFKNIKQNLFRLKLTHFASVAILKIFEPGLAEPRVWQKVLDFFTGLENSQSNKEELIGSTYFWCHDILVLNGLNPRSPDFSPINTVDLKKKTEELFLYHFGISISKLI